MHLSAISLFFQYFETDDAELYKSKIKYIEENDINDMELTFSEEEYSPDGQGAVKVTSLTLSPPNKLSSAKFLVCCNFQSAAILLKVGENLV